VLGQALQVRRALQGGRVKRAFFGGPPLFARPEHDDTIAYSEALLFGFFILNFYLLETWATYASPYFIYAQSFPLMLPTPPWSWLPEFVQNLVDKPSPGVVACHDMVAAFLNDHRTRTMPIEIPLMEGTLAYVALHATRLVRARYWSRPFLAGFAVLALDALLDPVVSDTFKCDGLTVLAPGLGLWRWFTVPIEMGQWFGIPLFNFGAWYGGALISIALPGLLSAGWRRFSVLRQRRRLGAFSIDRGRPCEVLVWAGILTAGWIVRKLNPIDSAAVQDGVPPYTVARNAAAAFVCVLLLAAFIAGLGLARRRADNWPRIALLFPPLFFLIYPLAIRFSGLEFDDTHWQFPWYFAIGIFLFCTFLVIYPYWRSLWPWSRRSSA